MRPPNELATLLMPPRSRHRAARGRQGTLAAVRRLDIATGFSSGSIEGAIIIDK
jgi:hypothetical protein